MVENKHEMSQQVNEESNLNARINWNKKPVGSQRSNEESGSKQYFEDIKKYRYGYETPFLEELLLQDVANKEVLEIGIGHGIDAVTLTQNGAIYSGLDITESHLKLTHQNFELNNLKYKEIIKGDLLELDLKKTYDVIYSFGVLHHISHEMEYVKKLKTMLNTGGELRVAVYSKHSFFNYYMYTTWILKNRRKVTFNQWQGKISDGAAFDSPITIKIRSKKEVLDLYENCGFEVKKYHKRGFVQNYIPFFGKFLKPNGTVLNKLGALLGWYHIFTFTPKK